MGYNIQHIHGVKMKIIVCVKQIQHTYTRTGKKSDTHYMNPGDSIFRINPCDEAAIELALGLKDSVDNATVDLVTLGDLISEKELRRCLATGADDLYHLPLSAHKAAEPFSQPDPRVKADRISRVAQSLGADIVLCGKESLDRASGQVGALVAHQLNLPFVSAITDLSLDRNRGQCRVQRSAGRGVREVIQCALPAVFSVDLGAELRLPTLESGKLAHAYEIRTPEIEGRDIPEKLICKAVFQPRPRPRISPVPDSSLNAYDRILQLLSGSRMEKKGEILTGSRASQVDGMIDFLRKNEFIALP